MPALPLIAMMLASLAIGTTEFSIQGLLPEIAADLGVDIPAAGMLVSGYALGVALGGPVAVIATYRLKRKTALSTLLGVFIVGHVLCAVAPDYGMLMVARVVCSFCHGAFAGIGTVVIVRLSAPERRAAAIAMMGAGIAAANILGVPAGTALGQIFGWRSTFWVIAALGVLAALAVVRFVPHCGRGGEHSLRTEFAVLGKLQVVLGLLLTVCVCGATMSVFTFIAPALTGVTGVPSGSVPLYLLLFGVGGVIGMQVGGRVVRGSPIRTIVGVFAANVAVYLTLLAVFDDAIMMLAMVFVWGFCFYFIAAPVQLHVVDAASEAPNLAATLIQSGFNVGNALGPYIGGVVLTAGLGYANLPLVGAAIAALGLTVALVSAATARERTFAPA
jgi:DHA1 family inner membrane transport protein